jgi:hypothetical protein
MGAVQRVQVTWTQRIARTEAIMSAAWQLLKGAKQLLLLPIASSACLMLLAIAWAVPAVIEAFTGASLPQAVRQHEPATSADAFLLSVAAYGVAMFFNAVLAICVLRKLEGQSVSIGVGLREAVGLLPQILGWALLAATVGMVLKAIERRSGFIGGVVAKLIGLSWTVATVLVVPVLVAERKGPIDAVRESVHLLRRTWGEDLLAGMGFGALYFFLSIPGAVVFVIGAGMLVTHPPMAVIVMTLAILYVPLLGLVLSTLSTIFDIVLYRYAKLGTITPGFDRDLLVSSFVSK